MKFFDPKKKEPTAPPARSVNPPPQPYVPPAPANPVVSPVTPASQSHAPKVAPQSNPNPSPVSTPASPKPAPEKTIVQEVSVPPKPALVTEKVTPQVSFQTVIGSSLMIKGDVKSEEDILVHGFVEGSIETSGNVIVGPEGKVFASIKATNVTISGKVVGNVTALGKVNIAPAGLLQGNIRAPRLAIAESALFRGNIDMRPAEVISPGQMEEQPRKNVSSVQLESIPK